MKTGKVFLITTASLLFLSSCGKKAPKCSDKKVVNLVEKIVYDQVYNSLAEVYYPSRIRGYDTPAKQKETLDGLHKAIYRDYPNLDRANTNYILNNIRTIGLNDQTGAYTCKGTLTISNIKTKEHIGGIDVAYLVELTDDNKSFIVTAEIQ